MTHYELEEFKVYRRPNATNNYLGTLAVGAQYLESWEANSLRFWLDYCDRHDLGLIAQVKAIEDRGNKRFDWQKIAMPHLLKSRIDSAELFCFIDYDIIPSPGAGNIFDIIDPEKIAVVSQRKRVPYGDVDKLLKRIAFFRHTYSSDTYPLDSYIARATRDIFIDHGLEPFDDFACAGLFVVSLSKWSGEMYSWFEKYDSNALLTANPGEQVYLNFHIQKTGEVQWLDYEWQSLWWFEMGQVHFELYREENRSTQTVVSAIENSLSRCSFLHFVGSWEKWAWDYVRDLNYENLEAYAALKTYQNRKLEAPSLGLVMPDNKKNISF